MASDTKNVKLGICKVLFGGVDLGYTQGGVDVTVKTETHKVNVDQFGKTTVNEYVMGREVTVKVPLAETTLANLVAIMPGATLVQTGGSFASGSITIATLPTTGQTIALNGSTLTFKTTPVNANDVQLGATVAATASNLAAFVNAASDLQVALAGATVVGAVVTLTFDVKGTQGNNYATVTGTAAAAVTFGGATLVGGAAPTGASRVDVSPSLGLSLLDYAKVLTLHPTSKLDADTSEDFTVYKAATSGDLAYAYHIDKERIYNCEFTGFPDIANGNKLFAIGDPTAT